MAEAMERLIENLLNYSRIEQTVVEQGSLLVRTIYVNSCQLQKTPAVRRVLCSGTLGKRPLAPEDFCG
jgi:hypothetical protein